MATDASLAGVVIAGQVLIIVGGVGPDSAPATPVRIEQLSDGVKDGVTGRR